MLFKKYREKRIEKEKAIRIMKEFVEGKITIKQFWCIYISEMSIRKCLYRKKDKLSSYYDYYDYKKTQLDKINLDNIGIRVAIFRMCKLYLQLCNISVSPKNDDEIKYNMFSVICPSWLQIDEDFLIKIIQNAPDNLSNTNKIKWCKNHIKEMFHYEKTPPKWLQNPEWPIIDGLPLRFLYQDNDPDNTTISAIKYHFLNPQTNEETIIEQFD